MGIDFDIYDLNSLIKVFDANYASDQDVASLAGLDVNRHEDVIQAVRRLLLPEFSTWSAEAQRRSIELLRALLERREESFYLVFNNLSLVFDDELQDQRAFMAAVLEGLESANYPSADDGGTRYE